MSRQHIVRSAIALSLGAVSLVGCSLEAALDTPLAAVLPESLFWEQVVGSDGDTLLVVRSEILLSDLYDAVDPNVAAATILARVRLDSTETQELDGIPTSEILAPVSNGRWLAWEEAPGAMRVLDLSTGASGTYSDPAWGYFQPVAIGGDQLLIEFQDRDGTGLVLINLATGARNPIVPPTAGVFGESTSLVGGSIVWYVYPSLFASAPRPTELDEPVLVPIEATSNRGRIERIEIETGNVTTLVEDAAAPAQSGFVETIDGRLAWGHWTDDYGEMALETLDVESGARKTIAQFRDSDLSFYRLMDLGPHGAIVKKTTDRDASVETVGDLFQTSTLAETYFVGWDGSMQLLLSQERSLLQLGLHVTVPRQLGNYAIVRDVFAGDYIVYDVTDGTTRRVRPFPEE